MHEYERLEAYQVKKILKKLEETLRKKFGVSDRGLGDEKSEVLSKFSRKVSRKWSSTNEGVEQVSRNNPPYQAPKLD